MRYGLTIFATDRSMDLAALARAAEDRAFASLYIPEHTHIPTSRRTPPPTGDEQLREEYKRTLDPFVALAAAAAVTDRIKLGTGILLPAQREPIVTAKAVATLDHVSHGRVVLGIGFGWNEDELEHHGVTMRQRRAVTRENLLAMRALWTQEEASFDGEFVRFSPSWAWPKPVQSRLPVLLGGGAGPILFRHIAEYGDGWIPIGGSGIAQALPDLHHAMEEAGRDPATLEIVPFGSIPDPAKLDYFASIGVTECVFRLPSAPAEEVMPVLDRWTALLDGR